MLKTKKHSALRLLPLLLILSAPSVFAQTSVRAAPAKHPSLAGTWIPKSEKDAKPDAGPAGWTNVIVEQQGDVLKFTLVYPAASKQPMRELTFYTDGRGETNKGTVYFYLIGNGNKLADGEVKSKTAWEGDALVVVHHMFMPDIVIQGGVVVPSLDVTMRWEVSADGKTLTRTIKQSNFAAVFRQIVPQDQGQIKETPLAMSGAKDAESKDTYVLLEEKH
jgi:hypothetical protein